MGDRHYSSPTSHGWRRQSSRRPSDRDSLSDTDSLAEKRIAASAADSNERDARRRRRRQRADQDGSVDSRRRDDDTGDDSYAVVPRNHHHHHHHHHRHDHEDTTRAVQHVPQRRGSDDSIASSSARTHVYDSRGRRLDDRRSRGGGPRSQYSQDGSYDGEDRRRGEQEQKKRSKLDPRVFLAALLCFATAAFCWNEAVDD